MLKVLLCVLGLALSVSAMNQNPVVNPQTLRKVFEGVKPYSDLSNAFYSIKGLNLLGEKTLDAQSAKEVCDFAKAKVDKANMESIYYATYLADSIPNCKLDSAAFQATLAKGDAATTVTELYYYVLTAEILKMKVDSKKVAASLTSALKTDSSIVNQGFSLHIAAKLSADSNKQFYNSIEDIIDQADEVDSVSLQYEGGVGTTSIVLEGIFAMSEANGKLPAKLSNDKLSKFLNYLVSKRFPNNIKSAYFLLRTATKLTNNKFAVPLFLNRLSPVHISSAQSSVLVTLTNFLGSPVKDAQINLDALSAKNTKTSILSAKKAFTAKSSDRTSFSVELAGAKAQLAPGFYTVTCGLNSDKKFFLPKNSVEVKVTTKVTVADVLLAVSDRDTTQPKFEKFEAKVLKLEADQQSKFMLKFSLKDQAKNTAIEAHQAFVKFTDTKSGREIVYLAETGLTKTYAVDIDFSTNVKNFNHQSGTYKVELIVSDALFENPTALQLSEIKLKFSEQTDEAKASLYGKKPEIKHLFREAEKTPSKVISSVFALLCFAPLALIIVLWFKIGFNFSRFEVSLYGIVFHIALALIFGLFYCYWIEINMFTTVRYLGILGLVAMVSGNKLLRNLATKREKSN